MVIVNTPLDAVVIVRPTTTPTRTKTPRPTQTKTPTPTHTPTRTKTPFLTRTSTPTPTKTPTRTKTPQLTPTKTPTRTCTPTTTKAPRPTPTTTPTCSVTRTHTPTQTKTPLPTKTKTPTVTPTCTPSRSGPILPVLEEGVTITTDNDWVLYIPKNYKIYTLWRKADNLSVAYINSVKSAVDFWSAALKGTFHPPETNDANPSLDNLILPTITTDRVNSFPNPMIGTFNRFLPNGKNDGFILAIGIKTSEMPAGAIAAATWTNYYWDPKQRWHFMPTQGLFYFNSALIGDFTERTRPSGRTAARDVIAHEVGHALGIGTMWYLKETNTPRNLLRSFVVGRGDKCINPNGNPKYNIFYSTDTGKKTRTKSSLETALMLSSGVPEATYTEAYIPTQEIPANSAAVIAYQDLFNVKCDAVPLEGHATQPGSYGGHWAEGSPWANNTANWAADSRQFNGVTYPGAPALHSELMTPMDESALDTPCSRITLGALQDLGYTVDMRMADNYEPFTHYYTIGNKKQIEYKFNNFGAYFAPHTELEYTNNQFFAITHLRRGTTYRFYRDYSLDCPLVFSTIKGSAAIDPRVGTVITAKDAANKPYTEVTLNINLVPGSAIWVTTPCLPGRPTCFEVI